MYIVKYSRSSSLRLNVSVWSKEWSDELNSNQIEKLGEKNTILVSTARKWACKTIIRDLVLRKKMEVLDG